MKRTWTRREAVKNLGRLGVMYAMARSPLVAQGPIAGACRPFSIVLHGLFVLDVFGLDNHIRISTPDVTGHSYLAGPWSRRVEAYTKVSGFHEELWDSRVQNVPNLGGMPILASHLGDPDHDKAYLSFSVPYPTKIRALRSFDESEVDYPGCCIQASKFPLVLSLEYDYLPNFPPIKGTSLDRSNNYHVFAESSANMSCPDAIKHGKDAIGKLWAMLPNPPNSVPLPKDPNKCFKAPDVSGWPCGRKEEEYGLAELNNPKGIHLDSIHLPLCANFIVP